jgi:hypothetical protein
MAHGTIAIDGTKVGTVIDNTAGNITQILHTGAPTSYEMAEFDPATGLPTKGYFCLVDNSVTPPRRLFSVNTHHNGSYSSPSATHKTSAYNIPFTSLYVQAVPKGGTWSVTTA